MKKNRMNKYIILGLLINTVLHMVRRYVELSDITLGLLTGLGFGSIALGIYFGKKDTEDGKDGEEKKGFKENFKRKLLKTNK